LKWEPYYEPVAENPYLESFYEDMNAWAFHSQVFFLTHRLRSHKDLLEFPASVVQDRSVYEDAEIFAKNLHLQGNITDRDYATYRGLFGLLVDMLKPPDLVVYLRASVPTLMERIKQRARGFESNISPEYLEQLNTLYESWIADFSLSPVLTVPADEVDFVAFPGHMDLIAEKVQEKLTGKEEVVFAPEDIRRFR
jgi:deoxyadenosine/deoxycytidine kinase